MVKTAKLCFVFIGWVGWVCLVEIIELSNGNGEQVELGIRRNQIIKCCCSV
jgi:hypothetical protein